MRKHDSGTSTIKLKKEINTSLEEIKKAKANNDKLYSCKTCSSPLK